MTVVHPDLDAEQAYLDRAWDLLDRGHADAAASMAAYLPGDRASARALRRALEVLKASKGTGSLLFGRMDDDEGKLYIGRRRVYDESKNLQIVSWHAPAAARYYEATAEDPRNLLLKRTFVEQDRRIIRLVDELVRSAAAEVATGSSAVSDVLLAELERSRDGAMRDVVATIQREQFDAIRAPIDRLLVVEGGPGTGKTVVGLHRAAWLVYNQPELRARGMLVVAPSATLLSYISGVLPLLGVNDVLQVQLADLYPGDARVVMRDDVLAERVKGSAQMASVLRVALRRRISVPADGLEFAVGADKIRLGVSMLRELIERAQHRDIPHNAARALLRESLSQALHDAYVADQRHRGRPPLVNASTIRRLSAFNNALDRVWPTFSPEEFLRSLYGTRTWLLEATEGLLPADERAALFREPAATLAAELWSEADVFCLDELAALLDGAPVSYGHIVVDEAQDLSPMQARALARRCPSGSMTILGDLAQARAPWTRDNWDELCAHLSVRSSTVRRLTVGYRVPDVVLEVASRQLPLISPGLVAPMSIRPGRVAPQVRRIGDRRLSDGVKDGVDEVLGLGMSLGVVVADGRYDELRADLGACGVQLGDGRDGAFASPATLVPAGLAKGLEFDAVLVVEPAEIVDASDDGRRALYTAMTRCTQALYIVHAAQLPLGLDHLNDSQSQIEEVPRESLGADMTESLARLSALAAGLSEDDVKVLTMIAERLVKASRGEGWRVDDFGVAH